MTWLGCGGIAIALVLLCVRAYRKSQAAKQAAESAWRRKARIAEGTLTECSLISRGEDEYYWCTVEYRVGGFPYRLTGDLGYTPQDIGRKVRVEYDPQLPSEARLVRGE